MLEHLKRLIKGSLIYGVGGFLNQFIHLLLLPLFTSYLTPEDYGILAILTLLSFFLTQIFTLGIGVSLGICYFEREGARARNQVITSAFIILMASSLIMLFLSNVLIKPINHLLFSSGSYQSLIVLTLFSTAFSILVVPLILKLQFEERQKSFVILTLLSTILAIGAKFILVILLNRGVEGMVEGALISGALTLLLFILFCVREIKLHINLKLSKELIRLGLPMVPSFLALYVLQQGNVYMLSHSDNTLNITGLYSIAFSFGAIMLLVVSAFTTAWFPFYMSFIHKKEEAKILFGHIMRYYILGAGLISLLFYVFAKPLIMIFTQPNFYDAYKAVGLIATAQFLIGVFSILLPPVYFAKKLKFVTLIQITSAILFIGASFFLINVLKLGLVGAGTALIFGYGMIVFLLYLWNQTHKATYLNIQYEWKRIAPFAGMYIFYIVIMLRGKNINPLTEFTIAIALFLGLATGAYFLLRCREKEIISNTLKYYWHWQKNKIRNLVKI